MTHRAAIIEKAALICEDLMLVMQFNADKRRIANAADRIRALAAVSPAPPPIPEWDIVLEALRPFAQMIIPIDDDLPAGIQAFDTSPADRVLFDIGKDRKITVGDLRRAKDAIAVLEGK